MMRKTFIYIALAIRAVFLFGINICDDVWKVVSKPSTLLMRISVVALIILSSINFEVFSQRGNCDPGERVCKDGKCHPVRECGQGVPPPPGLPIDSKLPYLLIAGLGLGIYFLKAKKTA